MSDALRLQNVRKSYDTPQGSLKVLDGVDLRLEAGQSLALKGDSGSGKSTLLHLSAGLDAIDDGEIWVEGTALTSLGDTGRAALRRDRIGLVFQQFNLIPSMNVADNIGFQARLAERADAAWIEALTARLGLADLTRRYPEQLSGGQQQRVAIARALAPKPALLLADEPTGNLDVATSDAALTLMLELSAQTGCALLMATHSARAAERLTRRAALSEGRLIEEAAAQRGAA
ncbi:MAG: ABC transporter ATP-binding protein [Rhodobacteraceae bacterium]|nr:ABC transporter ATP-binding protein [Paracoccaceae bacterium]